jgi:hypothetical protein
VLLRWHIYCAPVLLRWHIYCTSVCFKLKSRQWKKSQYMCHFNVLSCVEAFDWGTKGHTLTVSSLYICSHANPLHSTPLLIKRYD